MASFRPSRTIHLPSRFAANAAKLALSTRRRPMADTSTAPNPELTTAVSTPSRISSPSSPLPPDSDSHKTLPPTGLDPARKCPAQASLPPASTDNVNDDMPMAKKAKTVRPLDAVDDLGMHADVQVMDIDDASDPHDEALNKTDATADIKAFFTPVPSAPGQTKVRMSCNLCRCVKSVRFSSNLGSFSFHPEGMDTGVPRRTNFYKRAYDSSPPCGIVTFGELLLSFHSL
jgi:hypothetical protein